MEPARKPAEVVRLPESGAKDSDLVVHVERLSARIATLEAEFDGLKRAQQTMGFAVDAGLDATKSRLGQIRNVEQRCRKIWEQMRALHQDVTMPRRVRDPSR